MTSSRKGVLLSRTHEGAVAAATRMQILPSLHTLVWPVLLLTQPLKLEPIGIGAFVCVEQALFCISSGCVTTHTLSFH